MKKHTINRNGNQINWEYLRKKKRNKQTKIQDSSLTQHEMLCYYNGILINNSEIKGI